MKWRVNGTRRFGSFHVFPQNIGSPGALTRFNGKAWNSGKNSDGKVYPDERLTLRGNDYFLAFTELTRKFLYH